MVESLFNIILQQFPCKYFIHLTEHIQEILLSKWRAEHQDKCHLVLLVHLNILCKRGFDVLRSGRGWVVYENYDSDYDDVYIGDIVKFGKDHIFRTYSGGYVNAQILQ